MLPRRPRTWGERLNTQDGNSHSHGLDIKCHTPKNAAREVKLASLLHR